VTENKSLELSIQIRNILRSDILQFIEPVFPTSILESYKSSNPIKRRDRIYNHENTLLTMVLTALQQDRSLQHSVDIFQAIYQKKMLLLGGAEGGEISSNTAAFSKARSRLEQDLIDLALKESRRSSDLECINKWHGRTVYNTDGTYFQMQDSPEIAKKYLVNKTKTELSDGYPQGLLQVITQQGTGFIFSHCIGSRSQSELDLFANLSKEIPSGSLLLADDLYNSYSMFDLLKSQGIDVITPDKKKRKYKIIKEIAPGDEIVQVNAPKEARKLTETQIIASEMTLRRITYFSSENQTEPRYLLSTILNENIEKYEFIQKFKERWDVEISIREIKTLMGINIARAKTEEMVLKEMSVALLAYNLVRKIIIQGVQKTSFSPEANLFEELHSINSNPLVDRKGRVYSRWSPGRPSITLQ
jgi:hypothetical protein